VFEWAHASYNNSDFSGTRALTGLVKLLKLLLALTVIRIHGFVCFFPNDANR